MRRLTLLVLVASLAADWPQFRGPDATGVATGSPPVRWSATENLRWKALLPGPGSSSPVVLGDRVFVTCYSGYGVNAADPGEQSKLVRHLVCLDRASGKVRWQADVPAVLPEDPFRGYLTEHGYASSTPATDGTAVYVFFGKSGVLAFDLDGKKLWQTGVGTESDVRSWGSSTSPVVFNGRVYVNAASEGRAVVALDAKTGKQAWKAEGNRLSLSFSTPAMVTAGGKAELVVAMPGEVWGLHPDTGKLAWHASIGPSGNVCPAVVPGDGVAYVTGGYQSKGTAAVKSGGAVAWAVKASSYVPTPVHHAGRLYCVTEDGIALCLNAATGATVYEERLAVRGTGKGASRPFYASPVLADGRLYVASRRAGVLVLKAGDAFEQLHQNPPLDDTDFNATPAASGDALFLRSNAAVYCVAAR